VEQVIEKEKGENENDPEYISETRKISGDLVLRAIGCGAIRASGQHSRLCP
jgi:hypothetical protein